MWEEDRSSVINNCLGKEQSLETVNIQLLLLYTATSKTQTRGFGMLKGPGSSHSLKSTWPLSLLYLPLLPMYTHRISSYQMGWRWEWGT